MKGKKERKGNSGRQCRFEQGGWRGPCGKGDNGKQSEGGQGVRDSHRFLRVAWSRWSKEQA